MQPAFSRVLGLVKVEFFLLGIKVVFERVLLGNLYAEGFDADVVNSALALHDLELPVLVNDSSDSVDVIVFDFGN